MHLVARGYCTISLCAPVFPATSGSSEQLYTILDFTQVVLDLMKVSIRASRVLVTLHPLYLDVISPDRQLMSSSALQWVYIVCEAV